MKLVRTESYNATFQVLWDYLTDVSLQKKCMVGLVDIKQLERDNFELHLKQRGEVKIYQGVI